MIKKAAASWTEFKNSPRYEDKKSGFYRDTKGFVMSLFRAILIIGIAYVILAPVIGIVAQSFFSNSDAYSPMVFTIPMQPTLERYERAIVHMDYWNTALNTIVYTAALTAIQVFVCSMVGYGFARFNFPLKKILFACVVVMIVIPSHTIMLPLYMTFRQFDPLGLVTAFQGMMGMEPKALNLMNSTTPIYLMTIFGCGLRSGLYIYIFNQFFRGLPKEIEEAAFVDGAGTWYTYFRIMLVNAMPAVITVSVFSLVWQYNDTFFGRLFLVPDDILLSFKLASLQINVATIDKVMDSTVQELYVNAGVVLTLVPVVLMYLVLQRKFIEGVERSGIVG